MAATVSESTLLNSLKTKAKGAWKDSRSKAAKPKGQRLPPGLDGAVAQVVKGEFKKSKPKEAGKEGIPYFSLKCVIVEPVQFAGTQFAVQTYMRDTEKSPLSKKLDDISNNLQLLGVETDKLDIDDLPGAYRGLGETKPFFKFRTWKPPADARNADPDPMCFIQGLVPEDWNPPEGYETVEDPEEPEAASEEAEAPEAAAPVKSKGPPKVSSGPAKAPAKAPSKAPPKKPAPAPEPEEGEVEGEVEGEAEGESEGEATQEWDVKVGDQYYFTPKGKKKGIVEVVSVGDDQTCTLRMDGMLYKNMPFTRLEGE